MTNDWKPLVCLLTMAFVALNAHGQVPRDVTALEVAQLPPFCWSQLMEGVSGPQYSIDRKSCGSGTNHYCGGLIDLLRARKSFDNDKARLKYLSSAKSRTTYTLNHIAKYPGCYIRRHVEATLREIEGRLMASGM